MRGGAIFVEIDVPRCNLEFSSFRHRVASIHQKIHQDLMDLIGVSHDLSQRTVQMQLQCYFPPITF